METPRTTDVDRDGAPLRSTLVAIGLTIFGLLVAQFATLPAVLFEPALLERIGEASIEGRTLMMILNFVGMAAAGVIYLLATGRGLSWVDLRVPTRPDWKYLIVGSIGSIALLYLINIAFTLLGISPAESQVTEVVGENQTMVLIMIVIVFFFNAPAEEFLFRNVVQKRLYEAFTRMQAVVVASVIFALVHFPMYVVFADSLAATAASLSMMFGGAVVFGFIYARTDNLVVPIAAHAALNAFQFTLYYIALEYDIEAASPETAEPALLVDAVAALPL